MSTGVVIGVVTLVLLGLVCLLSVLALCHDYEDD